jgi:hypothetical protein
MRKSITIKDDVIIDIDGTKVNVKLDDVIVHIDGDIRILGAWRADYLLEKLKLCRTKE